jgi:L-alanine-DL-glutamate epimerase-like enolase superfamily enzyme
MRKVELRERTVPIGSAMRNASIAFDSMTASALVMRTETHAGYAFDSIGRYGKGALLRERFIPRLLNAAPESLLDASGLIDPEICARVAMANEKPGGHGERPGAIGLIEAAAWDLRAKQQRVPLWKAIGEYFGIAGAGPRISVYASCGHFRTDDVLTVEVRKAIDAGYRCVKIKVGGGLDDDMKRLERAAAALPPGAQWAVDVNGALQPEAAEKWFDALAPFKLAWVEEPAPPLDFEALKRYSQMGAVPLATGENLFSFEDARNLLRYGGLRPERDFLQFDPLLSYGVVEYEKTIRLFESERWARHHFLPHAGHLFAAHCVAGLRLGMAEAAPDPVLPYGGYWDGVPVDAGSITLPELPGVGYEAKRNVFEILDAI